MSNIKACKSCNKPIPYTERNGLKTYNQRYGFGISCGCFAKWMISDKPGAKEAFNKMLIKNKRDYEKTKKEKTKKAKEKLKTLSDWKSGLQKEINLIVRLIDKGHPCIATQSHKGKQNAGHYISVGSNETIRFHLENIWLQSEHSNMWKAGDTLRYQDGIAQLYGSEYLEHLNSLKSIEPIKLTIDEIKDKISICRGIVKWLKLQDRKFTVKERLELRQRFNQDIGIY